MYIADHATYASTWSIKEPHWYIHLFIPQTGTSSSLAFVKIIKVVSSDIGYSLSWASTYCILTLGSLHMFLKYMQVFVPHAELCTCMDKMVSVFTKRVGTHLHIFIRVAPSLSSPTDS